MIVRCLGWMGSAAGTESNAFVQFTDLLLTFCEMAGADTPVDVTGKNLLRLIRGEQEAVRSYMHGQIDNQHMFHDGRHKYLYFADDGAERFFDKDSDPLDEHNLAGDTALLEPIRSRFVEHLREEDPLTLCRAPARRGPHAPCGWTAREPGQGSDRRRQT